MLPFKEVKYVDEMPKNCMCVMGADIGGTNSNFGIFQSTNGNLVLILSLHFKSQDVTSFTDLIKDILDYLKQKYGITIKHAGFAAAGVVSEDHNYAKPTNLDVAIDAKEILQKTGLKCAFIINDFEIIGHGFNRIAKKDLVLVNEGKPPKRANKAIVGAGTGLGKCILTWNEERGRYMPLASEGGHADFAAQDQLEIDLIKFIQTTENFTCDVSWEDVLSGNGIRRIYRFFDYIKNGKKLGKDNGPHPDEIFNSRHDNEQSMKTFRLYTKLYARCAKNFALDALALSGVYIAGGIAAKNLPLFELPEFMDEFINCGKQQELLKEVPIYVITDYNISLYGAAEYMVLENMCDI